MNNKEENMNNADQPVRVPQSSESASTSPTAEQPKLAIMFYILAALSFIGGIILAYDFLPGDPGEGREWKAVAYQPAITMFTIGLVQSALFTAIGSILTYLRRIEFNTVVAFRKPAQQEVASVPQTSATAPCPTCRALNPSDNRFCNECGAAMKVAST